VLLSVRLFVSDRRCLLLVLPLATVLFSTGLAGRDFWAPDEPRTGVIVRGILESGSWAALSDNGQPYLEKPPLAFWLGALASRAAGRVSEFAVRLPSSVAAMLSALVLFYLGRDLFGRRVGALAAIVAATSKDFFMEARWAHPDMLFALFLLAACLAYRRAGAGGRRRWWLAGFYVAIGLAILTKGPAGLALPLLAILAFHAATRDRPSLRRSGIVWGAPLAILPTAIWLLAFRASTGASFPLGQALGEVARRVTSGVHHPHPFHHLLASLAIEFLPWTLFLPAAVWLTFPRPGSRLDRENAYLYSWILVILSVFALSAEKRGVYLLPLLPLLAILVARLWDTALMGWDPSPVDRGIGAALVAGLLGGLAASGYYLPRIAKSLPELAGPAAWLAAAVLLTTVAAILGRFRRGGGFALSVFASGIAASYLLVAGTVLPALDPFKSARAFSRDVAGTVGTAPLGIYPDPHDAYVYYTERPIQVLTSREGLRGFLASAPRAFCLMEDDQFEVERRLLDLPLQVIDRDRIGHRAMVLVSGAP
jgi:4-amino-4-deoxy-L-arabinose transferase-like glycosyltransferase